MIGNGALTYRSIHSILNHLSYLLGFEYFNTSLNKVYSYNGEECISQANHFSSVDINYWIITTNLWLSDYTVITLCLCNLVNRVRSISRWRALNGIHEGPCKGAWQLKNEIRGHIKCHLGRASAALYGCQQMQAKSTTYSKSCGFLRIF